MSHAISWMVGLHPQSTMWCLHAHYFFYLSSSYECVSAPACPWHFLSPLPGSTMQCFHVHHFCLPGIPTLMLLFCHFATTFREAAGSNDCQEDRPSNGWLSWRPLEAAASPAAGAKWKSHIGRNLTPLRRFSLSFLQPLGKLPDQLQWLPGESAMALANNFLHQLLNNGTYFNQILSTNAGFPLLPQPSFFA